MRFLLNLLFPVLLGPCLVLPAAAEDPPPHVEQDISLTPAAALGNAHAPSSSLGLLPIQAIPDSPPAASTIDLTIAPDSLWHRIRNGFGMPDLHVPLVADRQSWYLNRPDMLLRIFERGSRYLYHIVVELERRGMPTELALLPMVESAFNPKAVSSARAMGIWQFIPSTGKTYNLDQNWWVDERRDIIASTDAALTYLQNIYEMHGDWHLALASYNWGENAVGKAIMRNQAKGLPTDYANLTMPTETRYYVPKLQALKNIVANPDLFGIHLPPLANQPYFETVMKPARMDVAVAARLAEISIDEFVSLNPAYHRPVMNGNQAGPLVLPVDKVNTFLANLERHEARDMPLSNWQTYQMKRGDTLDRIAAHYGIDVGRLKQINGITSRLKVGPGFNLLLPRPGSLASHDQVARALPQLVPDKPVPIKIIAATANTAKSPAKATGGKTRPAVKPGIKPSSKPATKKPAPPAGKKKKP